MDFYVPFALFFILLCFVNRQNAKSSSKVFVVTMALTFVFAAIRYKFGPDWFNYYDVFQEIQQLGVNVYLDFQDHNEPLFIHYFAIFPKYTLFLALNSLFWFGSYFIFFRRYVDSRYYWFVLLMLFFNIDCILNNLVAMRQAITAYLFIFAFFILVKDYKKVKRKVWFVTILILCMLIHTSCLVLLPLVFVNTKKNSLLFTKQYLYIIIGLAIVSIFIGRSAIVGSVSELLIGNIEDFQRYKTYLRTFGGDSTMDFFALLKYFLLIVLKIIPLIFIHKQGAKEVDPTQLIIYKYAIITATIGCIMVSGLLSRFMMILNPFYIAAIVRACTMSHSKKMNVYVLLCVSFNSVYSFYYYLQADYSVSFLTYQTVFSAPFIP